MIQTNEPEYWKYHTKQVYNLDYSEIIGYEFILDENEEPIPLSICICHAYESSECRCQCNSWDLEAEKEWDRLWEEDQDWLKHREDSYSGNYDY